MISNSEITVTKIEAARRQLEMAIVLWFAEEDQVPIHTLACAAHQIIHDINVHNNGRDLLLNSPLIRPDKKNVVINKLKKEMNFFKHADRNPTEVISFNPAATEFFIFYAILGLESLGHRLHKTESLFAIFFCVNYAAFLTDAGVKSIIELIQVNNIDELKILSKRDVFNLFFKESLFPQKS